MEFRSADARAKYDAVVRAAAGLVVGLDFDGTLSPIVDQPDRALIHPDAPQALVELAPRINAVAIITGRPVRTVLELGRLAEVGRSVAESGRELFVLGQYGNERWTSAERRVVSPEPPRGIGVLLDALPRILSEAEAPDAWVEEKGLAVAVHTRRLADPQAAFERLLPRLTRLAHELDLDVEPGKSVIEIRSGEVDKGVSVRALAEELAASAFVFVGDDLGDLAAFEAVAQLAEQGLATLSVCSASDEESALLGRADVVVNGPAGTVAFLRRLAGDIS